MDLPATEKQSTRYRERINVLARMDGGRHRDCAWPELCLCHDRAASIGGSHARKHIAYGAGVRGQIGKPKYDDFRVNQGVGAGYGYWEYRVKTAP
jgi:hypothetical protein